jgi:hypothetical protein
MEDIIDIIVTETTNLIEITSQSTDEVIDVNIIDNREDVTLNVTPTVVEININSLTGNFGVAWGEITGTLSSQIDLNTALGLKADLVGGKVPSSQLPSYVDDVVEVATYSALPATGETGKIYVILDTNKIYRWSGSVYVEIADSTAVWGAITGTLSSQTDLQNALNAKFNNPTGDSTQYLNGAGTPVTFPIAGQAGTLVREVRNTTGATLTKGTVVYISGATGNKPTVSKALATGDSTSAQTFGLCQADISNNSNGYVVCVGDIIGLDTSAISEGVQLYLSSTTAGTYTTTKQVAPAHLVYIGVVTRSHPTQGQIEVKIQNGYELDEIHDVLIISKTNNDGLFYESSTSLWKNKSIATVLGYSPEQPLTFSSPLSRSTNAVSIPAATSSVNGYLTSTDWSTFNGKQAALSGTGFVKISGTTISYDNSTYLTTSSASSTYLAKTGGTLTGSLNGTTAVFSGAVWGQTGYFSNTTADNALAIYQSNASYHAVTITNSGSGGSALYASGSVTVIGTLLATGVISAQSGLANGIGQSFALPTTSGTLALTSQLASYLPLSGGTLTGALSGTSATFSGVLTNGGILKVNPTSGYATFVMDGPSGSDIVLRVNGVDKHEIYNTLTSFNIYNTTTTSVALSIANSTGAATFSSSVNVGNFLTVSAASTLLAPSSGKSIEMVYRTDGANDYAFIQAYDRTNSVFKRLDLNSAVSILANGNVGIGTTAPNFTATNRTTLDINGTSSSLLALSVGGASKSYLFQSGNDLFVNNTTGLIAITAETASNITFATSNTERMRITSGGNVSIGYTSAIAGAPLGVLSTSASQQAISIWNNATSGTRYFIEFSSGSSYTAVGSITYNGTTTSYNMTSDYRLKEDLKPINGLEIVNKIKVYDYKWKSSDNRMDGVLAHELAEVLPYAVTGIKDGDRMQSVDYSKIVPVMVQAIKDLKAELDTLKNK